MAWSRRCCQQPVATREGTQLRIGTPSPLTLTWLRLSNTRASRDLVRSTSRSSPGKPKQLSVIVCWPRFLDAATFNNKGPTTTKNQTVRPRKDQDASLSSLCSLSSRPLRARLPCQDQQPEPEQASSRPAWLSTELLPPIKDARLFPNVPSARGDWAWQGSPLRMTDLHPDPMGPPGSSSSAPWQRPPSPDGSPLASRALFPLVLVRPGPWRTAHPPTAPARLPLLPSPRLALDPGWLGKKKLVLLAGGGVCVVLAAGAAAAGTKHWVSSVAGTLSAAGIPHN